MSHSVVLATFPSRSTLTKALDHLIEVKDIEIARAAILTKAHTGELTIVDDEVVGEDEGRLAGGAWGAALAAFGFAQLGALALPGVGPILALGVGALAGGLLGSAAGKVAAALMDDGFDQAQIQVLAERLQADRPALVLEVEGGAKGIERLRAQLTPYRAEIIERLPAPA
jgi:uncharacterized membrane protein